MTPHLLLLNSLTTIAEVGYDGGVQRLTLEEATRFRAICEFGCDMEIPVASLRYFIGVLKATKTRLESIDHLIDKGANVSSALADLIADLQARFEEATPTLPLQRGDAVFLDQGEEGVIKISVVRGGMYVDLRTDTSASTPVSEIDVDMAQAPDELRALYTAIGAAIQTPLSPHNHWKVVLESLESIPRAPRCY